MRSKDDDGVDPDAMFGAPTSAPTSKLDQLCAQVADAIGMALATASNAVLRDLAVVQVRPRRGAASLSVVIGIQVGLDRSLVAEHVARAAGYLRAEVASAILRARVPDLVFEVVLLP